MFADALRAHYGNLWGKKRKLMRIRNCSRFSDNITLGHKFKECDYKFR
jgi:hypothetical protein